LIEQAYLFVLNASSIKTTLNKRFKFNQHIVSAMSQATDSASFSCSNKPSESKDTKTTFVHAKLRALKQQLNQSGTESGSPHSQSLPVDESQAEPARMTRKRAAHLANLEDIALHKSIEESPKRIGDEISSPGESISQICLCQPDPKIPRPRNGKFNNKKEDLLLVTIASYALAFSLSS
jgi:hypothetical protein